MRGFKKIILTICIMSPFLLFAQPQELLQRANRGDAKSQLELGVWYSNQGDHTNSGLVTGTGAWVYPESVPATRDKGIPRRMAASTIFSSID